jgi:galacturan 1,4-alpha-galacturonidase
MLSLIPCAALTALASLATALPAGPSGPPAPPSNNGKVCTVTALGNQTDDVPQILQAFEDCNNGGTVSFPENQNYWIAQKLNPIIRDVTIDWRGIWTLSDDLDFWRNNSFFIQFQNHRAGFVISGERIHINGHGTGGIFGNGNAWYNAEKATTLEGRPMPFVFWNVSDVAVEHFFVKDPPLWSLNIMNGTNMWFDDILCNATAVNAPFGTNWVQNTDGFDTMDANDIKLTNFVYQGGDDCIAVKPRSFNIFVQNITCHGGNGIAIGSLGQYLEDSSVANVVVKDANILTHNADMEDSAYIKTWVGVQLPQASYESAGLPNGGGWGTVQNIVFENFFVQGAGIGPAITQDNGDNGSFVGSSLMEVSNIAFVNWTGYVNAGTNLRTASVSCSKVHPCFNIAIKNVTLAPSINATETPAMGTCQFTATNGVSGLVGC